MKETTDWNCIFKWLKIAFLFQLCFFNKVSDCAVREKHESFRHKMENNRSDLASFPPVQLKMDKDYAVLENGIAWVTFTVPVGMVISIQYNGIDNLLEKRHPYKNRGYWDVVWSASGDRSNTFDQLDGTKFSVVVENENQVEISFKKTYDPSLTEDNHLPLNVDKRYILLRGYAGFYSYAIFERLKGWPALNMVQGRIAFKLQQDLFQFMAVGDGIQKIMATEQDRERGQVLDFPEAVRLTNPQNKFLRGEVDDKYQYANDNKDSGVHGWICKDPPTGFWMMTPSYEFKNGGPMKQELTSHSGPTTLSMFFGMHYAGEGSETKFEEGEAWKKVFGPVAVYLNSVPNGVEPRTLWVDAKKQLVNETGRWPYDFPESQDYPKASQRGTVSGRLLVCDRYVNKSLIPSNSAYVGLAPPGEIGSWQRESKGYQFWTQADTQGNFVIKNVREGNYSLYAWVPGFIGDYKSDAYINVVPAQKIILGDQIYEPPRNGPTLWEIGIPDRTAMEFFIPDPNPKFKTKFLSQLYTTTSSPQQNVRFRQYGLWDRYTELYPLQDLNFTIGVDNYQQKWFYAHVNRNVGNKSYVPTTWQIVFYLERVNVYAYYTLQLAIASANFAELQVRINDPYRNRPHFTAGLIGRDNAIARHGVHGLYWQFNAQIHGSQFVWGKNVMFLRQTRSSSSWEGLMYDYLRLEGPPYP